MFRHNAYRWFEAGRPASFEGPWHGPWQGPRGGWGWERRPSGRPPILPLLLAGLLVRAALRRGAHGSRFGRGGPCAWGHPADAYGWHKHGPGHGHGYGYGRGFGGPWGRGRRGWRDDERGASLRSEIAPLIALVRDTMRRGGPTPAQLSGIREVLGDARKRIAAILAEGQPPHTMV